MSSAEPAVCSILIVDDDLAHAEMVQEYLRLSGFEALESALSLEEMWACLDQRNYDVVLLDYLLPDGNGLEALAEINQRGYMMPVVMVTGQGDERVAAQAIQRGASDYLVKTGDYLVTLPALIRKTRHAFELQESVRRSIEQIRYQALLLSSVRDAVVVWDVEGRITYWNPAAEALYGWSASERLGQQVQSVYLSVFSPPLVLPPLDEPGSTHVERQVETTARGSIWVSSLVTPLSDASGTQLIGYMDVAHDITDRKRMEAQIRAAQTQLVQAARLATLGELASGVAHQINNPLTTIIADAQILLRQLPASHPARDSAEAIEQAGWRLQSVVQRLMDFSRPAQEQRAPVDANATIQRALALVGAQIDAGGFEVQAVLAQTLPPVWGVSRQLEDLWVNLLLLARDAAQEDGPRAITIRTETSEPEAILVSIRDRGRPISLDQLEHIFEPDFVGSGSGRGSGMELSICREIVRQHGGTISVESAAGHDTIFRIQLPAAGGAEPDLAQ
jgi:two-component system, cell cycle sensor histidine kinase and response regulator CckA